MKEKKIIAFGLLSLLSTAALAVPPLPIGWYAEGNIGYPHISDTQFSSPFSNKSSGLPWNIDIGYKFIPYFGAELGYTRYGSNKVTLAGVKVATNKFAAVDAAAKAMLPLGPYGFELFGKLGVARLFAEVDSKNAGIDSSTTGDFGPYVAIGAAYSYLPNLAFNVQFARAKGQSGRTGTYDLYSLGVTYIDAAY